MGSFCSSQASASAAISEEKTPLRPNRRGSIANSVDDNSSTEDPEEARPRKARRDWIKAIAEGNAPETWLIETIAETNDELEIVETVFDNGDRAIHKAIRARNFDLLYSLLFACGANIDAPNAATGDTPLMVAAAVGDQKLVQLLLGKLDASPISRPANASFKNEAGQTAGDIAAQSENKALWALLCPDKLSELLVNNPHALSAQVLPNTPPPPDMSGEGEPPPFDIAPMTTATATEDDDLSSVPSATPEGRSPSGRRDSDEVKMDDSKSEDATTPRRPSPPRRSSSVNVINGIPEDLAPVQEWKGGFIQKRKPDWLGSWQRRYLLIKGDYIGWASEQVDVEDPGHPRERKKFNSYEHLNKIDRVEAVESSSNCKFKVFVSNATKSNAPREYEFKAESPEERDDWVRVIKRAVRRVRRQGTGSSASRKSPRR